MTTRLDLTRRRVTASLLLTPLAASLRLKSGSGSETESVVIRSRNSAGPSRAEVSATVTATTVQAPT